MRFVRPPRVFRRFLSLWVPDNELDFLWADLGDQYAEIVETDGRRAAFGWLIREVRVSFEPWWALRFERAEGPQTRPREFLNRRASMTDRFVRDVRYAVRALRRRPLLTLVAVLTLTIGIGANTAIFSVVNGVMFKGVDGLEETD